MKIVPYNSKKHDSIFADENKQIGYVRGDIDGVLGLGIVVADIANVSDHAGIRCGQLICIDGQDAVGSSFACGQGGL